MTFRRYQHLERFGTTEVERIELVECYVFPKIDGNKHNNSLDNLEWCTNQENIKHSIETGLKDLSFNKGENNSRSILDNQKVREIKNKLKSGFRNIDLATEYNVSQQLICDIKKYRRWKDIT